jgi:hypothetical protein
MYLFGPKCVKLHSELRIYLSEVAFRDSSVGIGTVLRAGRPGFYY